MTNPFWRDSNVLWKQSRILKVEASPSRVSNQTEKSLQCDFFHIAIAPVLKFSQLFGVFPLHNVMERLPERFDFKWISLTGFISVLATVGGYSVSVLSLKRLAKSSINAISIAEPLFFAVCATSTALFCYIAKHWKTLITTWSQTEVVFLRKPFRHVNLTRSIRSTAAVVLFLAFVEHALSVANNIANLHREALDCNWTITDPIKYFAVKTFSTAFYTIPYNLPVAIYNEYVVLSMTFAWNFVDLFIVLVSIGLATRFTQLNVHISDRIRQRKPTSEPFWEQTRLYYVSLCELVGTLNHFINRLVFLSYANDLYFICLQIMNASQEQTFPINKVYFCYSFTFLLLRTFLMFWFSSQVQDASNELCKLILRVPNDEYCEALQRVQMYSKQGVSLTGMGIFLVSRRIFLTIAGTILTYELVLLSYQKKSTEQSNSTSSCEPWQLT